MTTQPGTRDVRFGHNLAELQDESGVDLSLLRANLVLTVEQRLQALEDFVHFAEVVRVSELPAPKGFDTTGSARTT